MKKISSTKPPSKKPSSKKTAAAKPTLQQIIINALDDMKAQNVLTLDTSSITDVFDTMIIASGSSNRQVRALAQHAAEEAKKQGMPAMSIEGVDAGEWVLVDFGDIVLHVMQPETREFYDLERLWQVTDKLASVNQSSSKPAPEKKSATQKSTATKTMPVVEVELITQSDAAKARKSPGKPKAAPSAGAKKSTAKTAPAKAGVYAKTGTKKPAATKSITPKKSTAAKKPAATKTASAEKKPAARKPRSV
jgi:ribosome-associated protein